MIEPTPWPGSTGPREDTLRYGAYGFDVRDAATKRIVYSAGFGSVFDEWVTTEDAKTVSRTFHESVRFPVPSAPVTVAIRKRGASNTWQDVWTTTVDPKDMFVNSAAPEPRPGAVIAGSGRPSQHRYGKAVDFMPNPGQRGAMLAWLRSNANGAVITYGSGHIHFDTGGYRNFAVSAKARRSYARAR